MPTAKPLGSEPVDQLSWFDAVSFTERLSSWLLRTPRTTRSRTEPRLRAVADQSRMGVRRAGMAVGPSAALVPPMEGGLGDLSLFKHPSPAAAAFT